MLNKKILKSCNLFSKIGIIRVRYLKNKKERKFRSKLKQNKILKDYIEKNELNIEQIINDYSGYVYTIIKNISNEKFTQEDIEKMISDTFFVLWRNAYKISENDKISSYLSGVVNNVIKKKKREIKANLKIEDYENILQEQNQIDNIYENQNKIKIMEKALENMTKEVTTFLNYFIMLVKK